MGRRRSILVVPPAGGDAEARAGADAGALAPFDPNDRGEWWWRQPSRRHRRWRLEAGGRAVATLEGSGGLGRTYRATFAHAAWTLKLGFVGGLEARRDDGEKVLRFVPHAFSVGHLELPGEERLEVKHLGIFSHAFEVRTGEGFALLRARPHHGFLRFEARIETEEAGRRRPDLALLTALAGVLATRPRHHSQG